MLLGFAAGAVLGGVLLALGVLGRSLPVMLVRFGGASLVAWFVFTKAFGLPDDNVKVIRHEINENWRSGLRGGGTDPQGGGWWGACGGGGR